MRLLVDTDVLVDVAMDRMPFADESAEFLQSLEQGLGSAAIAWHSAANLYYLVRKPAGDAPARDFLYELTRFVEVAPSDASHLRVALKLRLADFEDAMQVVAAIAFGASAIVTRNLKVYKRSPIPAIEPSEAIRLLG